MLVTLKRKEFDEKTIATLSKLIPQSILFVLECGNESKLAIYHSKLMQTDWMPTTEQKVELRGLNLDKVWENLIRSLECGVWNEELSLDENIALHEKQAKLEKEIAKLEKQARNENQPKKKFEQVQKIKTLTKRVEELNGKNC